MAGKATRTFRNLRQRALGAESYGGPRAITGNRYKLILDGTRPGDRELYDLASDQGETKNLVETKPDVAAELEKQLRSWQQSVTTSLLGQDYE
jgi:hypothetical protein